MDRLLTWSLRDPRVVRVLAAALKAADPGPMVANYLAGSPLPPHRRLFFLGLGKAAEAMTRAAVAALPHYSGALIITKNLRAGELLSHQKRVTILNAGHPIPDERSLAAGWAVIDFAAQLGEDDLLICLISGGGSALIAAPPEDVSLTDLQELTGALLASGASIDEINVLRRKLDRLKGGGLAAATHATVLSLILSDVVGDHLEAIASGPTVPDLTSSADAASILARYRIRAPKAVLAALSTASPSVDVEIRGRVQNVLIGSNHLALAAAGEQARKERIDAEVLGSDLHGEAQAAGRRFAHILNASATVRRRPFCLLAGGETTVSMRGPGKGGRNQEVALATVDDLAGLEHVMLITLATDGEDGPTDAAGAVVTGETSRRALQLGMRAESFLARNDAYTFFAALSDLLKPGPTGTNVNDLTFLFGL